MKSYRWLLFISLFIVNLILTGCEEPKKVVFSCETDKNGEHTTKVKYQNQTRDLIVWKRTDFIKAGFPPQRRCEEVTPRLQTAYDNGTLKTLTWGYTEAENNPNQRFKSLCTTTGKECHTLILTLLESDDPDYKLKKFTAVLNGDASEADEQDSCAVPQQTGANLTCTVDIFKVFNK
ncbi:COP23 domain-containing protein [Anabaena sp. UHCC 0451]|uniref:COP23 domain-containing protein n=1 Tax=Anabaena sp. UHCC 0451 TaxID=2055235 RepID=UPI002B20EB04|nr:COP23 domain-containing protein [Anabaena sp. UHCC 0451]MEA5577857.1 COP23 domain-containing protein [Anabaena sp. UHCC 0451]